MAAIDDFEKYAEGLESPVDHAETVTNDVEFTRVSRGLYIGTAGNANIVMASGQTVSFNGLPAGEILPVRATKVLASGTTAGGIVNLY